jgi:gamma-glutamyltranspeptidase/glutathione hydrolase
MKSVVRTYALLIAAMVLLAGMPSKAQQDPPEDATGRGASKLTHAARHMVAAAHPDAVEAGLEMLRRGGSAADAAIAVQLVLNVVEPQSSGIGGGAFALHYEAATRELRTYDGRETAPASAAEELFLNLDGSPMRFGDAVVGGRSVGTPGTVALLARLHAEHGKLPWADLFAPAIALARHGFIVGPRLAAMLDGPRGERLRTYLDARAYFFPHGDPLRAGTLKRNPALSVVFDLLAEKGPDVFYKGPIARSIVNTLRGVPDEPGLLTLDDLASYEVVERPPVCLAYRSYRVCGMGPPSSGAIAIAQILGILENYEIAARGPGSRTAWHLIAEASKLAFADRNRYVADSDFADVPVAGLIDPTYLAGRAAGIDGGRALDTPVAPGRPPGAAVDDRPSDDTDGRPGTSHISIVDGDGNAISMTTTIEGAFGSQVMTRGFMLNNELTDFAFVPERDGLPVANRVEPGKRPRSSMAPTMVFDADGDLRLVVGSPGGSAIIGYVARTLVAVLDWGLDIQAAIDLGHVVNRNGATDLEKGTEAVNLKASLEALGHTVRIRDLNSGLHGIEIVDGWLSGGADPRREGVARGD